jgi:hypothetical protein
MAHYSLKCKGFSDVGVSVDSLDCSTCVSDPVFV